MMTLVNRQLHKPAKHAIGQIGRFVTLLTDTDECPICMETLDDDKEL